MPAIGARVALRPVIDRRLQCLVLDAVADVGFVSPVVVVVGFVIAASGVAALTGSAVADLLEGSAIFLALDG